MCGRGWVLGRGVALTLGDVAGVTGMVRVVALFQFVALSFPLLRRSYVSDMLAWVHQATAQVSHAVHANTAHPAAIAKYHDHISAYPILVQNS